MTKFEFEHCRTSYMFVRFEIHRISRPHWVRFWILQTTCGSVNHLTEIDFASTVE